MCCNVRIIDKYPPIVLFFCLFVLQPLEFVVEIFSSSSQIFFVEFLTAGWVFSLKTLEEL